MTSADVGRSHRPPEHRERDDARQHDLGQVTAEVGRERIDALDAGSGNLACVNAVERCRVSSNPTCGELEPELREHVRRGAGAGELEAP